GEDALDRPAAVQGHAFLRLAVFCDRGRSPDRWGTETVEDRGISSYRSVNEGCFPSRGASAGQANLGRGAPLVAASYCPFPTSLKGQRRMIIIETDPSLALQACQDDCKPP